MNKPNWWDRDYTDTLKKLWSWVATVLAGRITTALKKDLSLSFKKYEDTEAWNAARAAAAKAEWLRLDAIQKEFERKGKKLTQEEVTHFMTSLERAQEETQRAAQEQRKWGKFYYGEEPDAKHDANNR